MDAEQRHEMTEEIDEMQRLDAVSIVSEVREFTGLSEFMNDPHLDRALEYVVKLMAKPDVPVAKVPALLVELQAIAAKMQLMGAYHQNVAKNTQRKNAYASAYHALDKLVDALKFLVKARL